MNKSKATENGTKSTSGEKESKRILSDLHSSSKLKYRIYAGAYFLAVALMICFFYRFNHAFGIGVMFLWLAHMANAAMRLYGLQTHRLRSAMAMPLLPAEGENGTGSHGVYI